MKRHIVLFLLFIPFILFAQEYTVSTMPNPKEADRNNYVSNPDGILHSFEVDEINSILVSLEADTHAEVAVVAVNSIGNEDIKQFAVKLFEKWGVGKKKIDNGLLILLVTDQRAVTFEVGYGLEGVITDALSKRIQTQTMLPYFRDESYGFGIIAGVEKVDALIREEPIPEYEEESNLAWKDNFPILIGVFIAWGLIALLLTVLLSANIKKNPKYSDNHDRYTAMKNKRAIISLIMFMIPVFALFIGLFLFHWLASFFFLLVPISIVPASQIGGRIQKRFRRQPFACDQCGEMMRVLSEAEDNKHLSKSQDFEEKIKSVDYDVFLCDNCHNTRVFRYNEPSDKHKVCSQCKTKALKKKRSKIIKAATYTSTGIQRIFYQCLYCRHEESKDVVIPKKTHSSGGGSGGSSGRSSSGGSFGGGRSGGGGSTSRW